MLSVEMLSDFVLDQGDVHDQAYMHDLGKV